MRMNKIYDAIKIDALKKAPLKGKKYALKNAQEKTSRDVEREKKNQFSI